MSVQNGERLATKQDLADMYQGILPYLGGMPEVLANKFSKGDMYSTDEKMIGQWIDGKPLYQKVYAGQCPSTSGNVYMEVDSDFSGKEYKFSRGNLLVPSTGNILDCNNGDGVMTYSKHENNVDKIVLYLPSNKGYSKPYYKIAVAYTKTTDSAISIGDDTDYSTEEKIVGTWIDGKPIYQKTVSCGTLPNATTGYEPKKVAHNITNLDKTVNFWGIAINPNTHASCKLGGLGTNSDTSSDLGLFIDSINVNIKTSADRSAYSESYVTIQYTKSTT